MNTQANIPFEELIGKHMLSGVDRDTKKLERYGDSGYFEDCQCLSFVLDGVTYTAIEDPNDGYRSSMECLVRSNDTVLHTFAPVEVLARLYEPRGSERYYGNCDVLELVDTANGKIVLSVGTENTDDYYPCFVAEWTPEHLAVNEKA